MIGEEEEGLCVTQTQRQSPICGKGMGNENENEGCQPSCV